MEVASLSSMVASGLLACLPRVLSVGVQEYADEVKHGDVSAAACILSEHLVTIGYSRLAALAEVKGFCLTLVKSLVDDQEFACKWKKLLEVCDCVPPVAAMVVKLLKDGSKHPKEVITDGQLERLRELMRHFHPSKAYTKLLLSRAESCHTFLHDFNTFISLIEGTVEELTTSGSTVLPVRGRPSNIEARLSSSPAGGIHVRLDSLTSPEFWAEFRIPVETLRLYM
jgi:hypothetical protein